MYAPASSPTAPFAGLPLWRKPHAAAGTGATGCHGDARDLSGPCCVAEELGMNLTQRTRASGASRGRGLIMFSVSATAGAASGRSDLSGWDVPAADTGSRGRERLARDAAAELMADDPAADACMRAYHREAAGRLALAALRQHHGPLG